MKLLKNKVNSSADGTYPLGKIRDDNGDGVSGSQVDAEFMNDYVQFMEKMFSDSGLTANGNPDNGTNGYQLFDAFKISSLKNSRPYDTYNAHIRAEDGSNPTAVNVFFNEISGITFLRNTFGTWTIFIPNCNVNKISIQWTPIEHTYAGFSVILGILTSGSGVNVIFDTQNFGEPDIDRLSGIIEIRKYD
jgi:hypothetical protein